MSKQANHSRVFCLMPDKIHHKFKVRAVKEKVSMTDVLNNLVKRYVEKELNLE